MGWLRRFRNFVAAARRRSEKFPLFGRSARYSDCCSALISDIPCSFGIFVKKLTCKRSELPRLHQVHAATTEIMALRTALIILANPICYFCARLSAPSIKVLLLQICMFSHVFMVILHHWEVREMVRNSLRKLIPKRTTSVTGAPVRVRAPLLQISVLPVRVGMDRTLARRTTT